MSSRKPKRHAGDPQAQSTDPVDAVPFETLTAFMSEGMVVFDANGRITFANSAAKDLFGPTADEDGKPIEELAKVRHVRYLDQRFFVDTTPKVAASTAKARLHKHTRTPRKGVGRPILNATIHRTAVSGAIANRIHAHPAVHRLLRGIHRQRPAVACAIGQYHNNRRRIGPAWHRRYLWTAK